VPFSKCFQAVAGKCNECNFVEHLCFCAAVGDRSSNRTASLLGWASLRNCPPAISCERPRGAPFLSGFSNRLSPAFFLVPPRVQPRVQSHVQKDAICSSGALVVLWWCSGGALVVLWWCSGGALVVLWWCSGGD